MKKIFLLLGVMLLLVSCGGMSSSDRGQLIGVHGRANNWVHEKPYGMILIPAGSMTIGKTNYDPTTSTDAPVKTISLAAFFMDDTEITNNEYREFVFWVRDSVFRVKLAEAAHEAGLTGQSKGRSMDLGIYAYNNEKEDAPYFKEMEEKHGPNFRDYLLNGGKRLDWNRPLIWDRYNRDMPTGYGSILDDMFIPIEERVSPELEAAVDVSKIVYSYYDFDREAAARSKESLSKHMTKRDIQIYPDTTVWVRDFTYSYNLPPLQKYFESPAYDDYPVVGVSWNQAKAFCDWRTLKQNGYQKSKKLPILSSYRLPTETEWEYAARGGIENATYPWGSPYLIDKTGCFMANFKPARGNYMADANMLTSRVTSYHPNNYGLYCMSGNVSEWTSSSYNPSSYYFTATLNPDYHDESEMRKVVRGGSWKDVSYFLQVGTRDYEYADTARSYIGFRTVQSYLGEESRVVSQPQYAR